MVSDLGSNQHSHGAPFPVLNWNRGKSYFNQFIFSSQQGFPNLCFQLGDQEWISRPPNEHGVSPHHILELLPRLFPLTLMTGTENELQLSSFSTAGSECLILFWAHHRETHVVWPGSSTLDYNAEFAHISFESLLYPVCNTIISSNWVIWSSARDISYELRNLTFRVEFWFI